MVEDFLAISIVGASLSVLVQLIKNSFGTTGNKAKLLTIALALIVGAGYVWLRSTPYFETVLVILGTASAVYAILLRGSETE